MKHKLNKIDNYLFLKPVRLYLEDLENIIEMIKIRGLEIYLSDKDYEFDSLDEIKQYRGSKISNLSMKCKFESRSIISIDFSNDRIYLILDQYDDEYLVLFHQLKDFLKNKYHWFQIFFDYRLWAVLIALSFIFLSFLMIINAPVSLVLFLAYAINPLLFIIYISCPLFSHHFTVLFVDRKFLFQNFLQRNLDKILLLLLGSIFGVIIKWLYDHIQN